MAGYDKYHDELVMVPKGSMARGSGDISPKSSRMSKADYDAAMKEFEAKGGKVQKIEPSDEKGRAGYLGKGLTPQDLEHQSKKKPNLGWYEDRLKKGGQVKKMAKGGSVKSSASKRADGCAQRGKTKGRMV